MANHKGRRINHGEDTHSPWRKGQLVYGDGLEILTTSYYFKILFSTQNHALFCTYTLTVASIYTKWEYIIICI